MMRRFFSFAVIAVAFVLACQPILAQVPTFKSRTDVVLVPVIVRDSSGAAVAGLSKDDFTVLENGKPQQVSVFERVETKTAAGRPPQTPPGVFTNELSTGTEPQRLTIIALDMANTTFADQAYARRQMLKFLGQTVDAQQPVALVAMTEGGVRMIHDFTRDTHALIAALNGVAGAIPAPGASGKVDRGMSNAVIRQALAAGNINADTSDPMVKATADEVERLLAFEAGAEEFGIVQRRTLAVTLESLQHLAQSFAGVPGKKSLIWVTGGFPFSITKKGTLTSPTVFAQGTTQVTSSETHAGIVGHLPESTAILQDDVMKQLEPLYEETLRTLADANIAVYPVDAMGLVSFFPSAESEHINLAVAREERERHSEVTSTLETFASMTGGNPCFNTNDLSRCFKKAIRDTESYYLIGYSRDQKNNKDGWRPIDVRVAKPGLQIRARSGYFYSNQNPSSDSARQMSVRLALTSPIDYTALPMTVQWKKLSDPPQKGKQPFKFTVLVPGNAMTIDEKNNTLNMEFIAVASGPKGERVDQVSQRVNTQIKSEAVPRVRADGLSYDNRLFLAPGTYTIHFVVRDNLTGRTGTVVRSVKVD